MTALLFTSVAGTIPAWLTVAGVLALTWSFRRGGGSTAIRSLEDAGRVMEKRIHELETQLKHAETTISDLRARTDISEAVQPLIHAVMTHETQAQARFEKTVTALDSIAEHLKPTPAGQ